MNMINFNDIFKSSFLEKTTSFSLVDALIAMVASFAVGLFIYFVYKKTFSGVIYSHTFNVSLIVLSMATTLIIMGISSNVLLSLGMVGALSIVRFRTPMKDPLDLVYLFWSIAAGILCGAGFIPLVIIGSILIGLVLVFFINRLTIENPYLLVVKYTNQETERMLEDMIAKQVKKHVLKSKSVMPGNEFEVTYEVRFKSNEGDLVNQLMNAPGVKSAVMVNYDGNFTA